MSFASIQMLRAAAALMVVAYHLRGILTGLAGLEHPPNVPLIANGFAGVDLFFVISGFIMVVVTREGPRGVGTSAAFLFARMTRIYPLWWLFGGLFAVYMLIAHVVLNTEGLGWSAIGAGSDPVMYLLKSFFLLPQHQYPILNVGWTLVHEMYFYLAFAVSILFARRWLLAWLITWSAIVISLALAGYSGPLGRDLVSLAVHPMTLEFILGALAAIAVQTGRRFAPLFMSVLGGLLLIAALAWVLPPDYTPAASDALFSITNGQLAITTEGQWSLFVLEWGRVLAFGLPAALLIYGLASLEAEKRFVGWRPMVVLGDWSYALYLSHILVLAFLARVMPRLADAAQTLGVPQHIATIFDPRHLSWANTSLFVLIALIATIITAGLSYRLFETPLIKLFGRIRRRLFSNRGLVLKPAPPADRIW